MTDSQVLDPGLAGYIEITPEILAADYLAEVRELAFTTTQSGFDHFLQRFQDYPAYLRSRKRLERPLKPILEASNGSRIIDTSTTSGIVWDALLTAHMAACCELFQGSRLLREQFTPQTLSSMAQQFISGYHNASRENINKIKNLLHSMDTVRTMQVLRALGLIRRNTSTFQQLALGAGPGTKDMYALHRMPKISTSMSAGTNSYTFQINQEFVKHIIITDLDQSRQELYAQYNQQSAPPVLAICADVMDLLAELPARKLAGRNLVTAIRIDHRMLPDVPGFLGLLSRNIDKECSLIMTMGAGNNADEFSGRINKLAEVFDALEKAALQPVLIKMHGPGSLEQQHSSLRFGNPSSSTFQILYCNLRRKQLHKLYK